MMKTNLQIIPGVGKNMADHLRAIGVTCVEDLKGRDPEELYRMDQARFPGEKLDRCCIPPGGGLCRGKGGYAGKAKMVELSGLKERPAEASAGRKI